MKLPSFVLQLLLAAVFSALVSGESLERARSRLSENWGTENPDSLTGSSNQLLHPQASRTEVLDLQDTEHDLVRVAFSTKPQALVTPSKEENGKKRRKGKGMGRKRDPCLRKYKDYCIHGACKYVKVLRKPSCICQTGYHGERCHGLTLPVENPLYGYDHTTILAVVAVVLSSVCLLIIAGLLMFRYQLGCATS
ncbi:proheparin-binding EGF-like growth factor isoform X2 [Monodelphis domestica]|uniref:proheparin-binding EGF-like growth factor isoform X2 n=1 Tax=Monodelphis domestica TaxID=13616 RepID=UPI0004435A11|nr:proheparin-binding EGF-like growth factor isoform X2 [Monodelphis domestica]